MTTGDRDLPLRERKKLRNRRALADAALRLFAARGFETTTLEELADEAEVSKSTFSRIFPAKEAAGIEAEAELWSAYLATLSGRELHGPVLGELHSALAEAVLGLSPDWDSRFLATRQLIFDEPALLRYLDHYRAGIKDQIAGVLAGKLDLEPDDLRPRTLAELLMNAFSMSGRRWFRVGGGEGGRAALLDGLGTAIEAIPASLSLSAPA